MEHLLRGHARWRQFVTDLKIMGWTLATIVGFKAKRAVTPPEFPFRCRHCAARLRFAPYYEGEREPGFGMYVDPDGVPACDHATGRQHMPMPSIR